MIHFAAFKYDGENYVAAGDNEDYMAVYRESEPGEYMRFGHTRWPSWSKFMHGVVEDYREGLHEDVDALEEEFGRLIPWNHPAQRNEVSMVEQREGRNEERDYSRFTDNPFQPPNASPELLEWYRKRDEAIRIWRETGDDSMAIEIGLFPSPEEEARLAEEERERRDHIKRIYEYQGAKFEVIRTSPDSITIGLKCGWSGHNHEDYIIGRIEGQKEWGVGRKESGHPHEGDTFDEAVQYCATQLSEECDTLNAIEEVDWFFEVEVDPPMKERLDALAGFLPQFESPGFEFGQMEMSPGKMPRYTLSPTASNFVEACEDMHWVRWFFDWADWKETPEAIQLRDDPANLAEASPEQIEHLLTTVIRQNRFVEGELGSAFESGLLIRIIRRAAVLAEELEMSEADSLD